MLSPARQSSICVDANVLLSAALSSCHRSSALLHDFIVPKLSFFMPAQGTESDAVQFPSLSAYFRPLPTEPSRWTEISTANNAIRDLSAKPKRIAFCPRHWNGYQNIFQSVDNWAEKNRKKSAGEEDLPNFFHPLPPSYLNRALFILARCLTQPRPILETIWKTVFNMQMKRNVRAHQCFEELLWIFYQFFVPSRPFFMFSPAHDWIIIPTLAFKAENFSRLMRGLGIGSAIVRLVISMRIHSICGQKNCKFMSSNLTLVPTNFSFLFVVLCPIKISLWHISLHRCRCRMTNNLFGLAFFAQCERLSLG